MYLIKTNLNASDCWACRKINNQNGDDFDNVNVCVKADARYFTTAI